MFFVFSAVNSALKLCCSDIEKVHSSIGLIQSTFTISLHVYFILTSAQLSNYFDTKLQVTNLALSGRSSKSFLTEDNYDTLKTNLKEGDYLLIGFGHNDEKSDDNSRFTDASKPLSDVSSFSYSLYENYVKLAIDKGATPILCTPIVRANKDNNYEGSSGHITATGDYRQAIIDLGIVKMFK